MSIRPPDVFGPDHLTDAAGRLGIDIHKFLLFAIHEKRDELRTTDPHPMAQTQFLIYAREGYTSLADAIKDVCSAVCNGEYSGRRIFHETN